MIEHWQDIVFTVGSIIFTIALLPAIFEKRYPPRSTCLITGSMLVLYSITDLTLNLWFSAASGIISSLIWTMMGIKQND
jgi:hypothetical protein